MRSIFLFILAFAALANAQTAAARPDERAEAVLAKAVKNLGGDRYLRVTSQVGRGKFSVIRENVVVSFQTFLDIIVFPDKERTDFRGGGSRTIQGNSGDAGWVYDGDQE